MTRRNGASLLTAGLLSSLMGVGCGAENDAGAINPVEVLFSLSKGGQEVPCRTRSEISDVRVMVFNEGGLTAVAGFPQNASCNDGEITIYGLNQGSYVLEVTAHGLLAGDPSAVLFKARTTFSAPSFAPIELSLRPEVAYLTLEWTFGSENLLPCTSAVDTVDVLVSAGTSQASSYLGTFGCAETPLVIEQPFPSQEYTIKIDANSAEGFPLYSDTQTRLLARGDNEHLARLLPLGGQLRLDWEFLLPGVQPISQCDHSLVDVMNLEATVHSREGGEPVTEPIDCAQSRPYLFRAARFTQGRALTLELVGEGKERFRVTKDFTMPNGDWDSGLLGLMPVGTASVAVQVVTSTCSDANVERYEVNVYRVPTGGGSTELVRETEIVLPATSVEIVDLPYGDYRLHLEQKTTSGTQCSVEGDRSIEAPSNHWDPFVL